ncbi:MAG: small basic protein [Candidatus Omnitrophica bacterium]|nr:small basic protein [Candidatus Omnitrophota bacterium]
MSLHTSLKRAEKITKFRSVMKRTERLKWLKEKGLWKESDAVLGLPKIKAVRVKAVKKEKQKEEAAAQATTQTTTGTETKTTQTPTTQAK